MTEYRVVPSGNMWRVQQKGGTVVSNHRKKAPAVKRAKKEAGKGDKVVIHRKNGTAQKHVNY